MTTCSTEYPFANYINFETVKDNTFTVVRRKNDILLPQTLTISRKIVLPQIATRFVQNPTQNIIQNNNVSRAVCSNFHTGLRVILIRHGETDWNREQRLQGNIDVPLNATGRQQAKVTQDFLSAISIDYAFSSSLSRAQETTSLILEGRTVPYEVVDALKELSHGDWNGMLETQIQRQYPQEFYLWHTYPIYVCKPNGETLVQVWKRVIPAWDTLISNCINAKLKTILVVAHKWINQILLCHVCGFGLEHFGKFRQDNCAINIINYPFGVKDEAYIEVINLIPFGRRGSHFPIEIKLTI